MVQEAPLISLGELLAESGETKNDNEILERLKLLAQERMPAGWMSWKVTQRSKEDIFGDNVDPQILTKLSFALPRDALARVFVPESTRLSEKGFRDLKLKMLDWAFARALITHPPAICNKIRGSAAATESFNEAMRSEGLISRKETDWALSIKANVEVTGIRSRSSSESSRSSSESESTRIAILEQSMKEMFATIMEKIELFTTPGKRGRKQDSSRQKYSSKPRIRSLPESSDDWQAPSMDFMNHTQSKFQGIGIVAEQKEAEENATASSEHVRAEGITYQQFGTEEWSRITYNRVKKRLHASPVFSAVTINAELNGQRVQTSDFLTKLDEVLGTITHGLLCQRNILANAIKNLAIKCPSAAEDLRKVLADGSDFNAKSDDLLQSVCAYRAEIIEKMRGTFKTENEGSFSVDRLNSSYIRDNGGMSRIFYKAPVQKRHSFQQSRAGQKRLLGTAGTSSSAAQNISKRFRQTQKAIQKRKQSGKPAKKILDKRVQRQQRRRYNQRGQSNAGYEGIRKN